jgi:sialidase-1
MVLATALAVTLVSDVELFVGSRMDPSAPFDTYRIPAICRTEKGTLLAFAEGRGSVSDQASNVLVMRRRLPKSNTWTPLQVVVADPPHSLNNPCLLPTSSRRVWLIYQRYPAGHNEGSVKPGISPESSCLTFLQYSDDEGETWSKPRDVSSILNMPEVRSVASGPGVGIELQRGSHKGRLLFPFNQRGPDGWTVFGFYSDDEGKTWQRGAPAPKEAGTQPNEVQCVELANGNVLMNARNQASGRFRLQGTSLDGGRTWTMMVPVPALVDPVCMGSILRVSFTPDLLAFTNPSSTNKRENGGLRFSRDGGVTWSEPTILAPGSFAYSCLVLVEPNRLGLLYETVQWKGESEIYIIRYREIEIPD